MKIRVDKTAEERMAKPLDLCECTHPHFKHTGGAQCRGVVSPHRCPCTEYVWSGKTSERSPTSETHRIAEALKSTGLGGIYDTFTDPADAIVQMSTYIAHLKGELTAAACDVASERSARERAERDAKRYMALRWWVEDDDADTELRVVGSYNEDDVQVLTDGHELDVHADAAVDHYAALASEGSPYLPAPSKSQTILGTVRAADRAAIWHRATSGHERAERNP